MMESQTNQARNTLPRWRVPTLIFAIFSLLTSHSFSAEYVVGSGTAGITKWEVTSPFDAIPTYGFALVTVTATNPLDVPTSVNYNFQSLANEMNYVESGRKENLGKGTLQVPGKKSASASVWLWLGGKLDYGASGISIDVTTAGGNSSSLLLRTGRNWEHYGYGTACISRTLEPKASIRFGNTTLSAMSDNYFDPDSLTADWRVFSGVATLIIAPEDWDKFSPAVRDAMRTWLRLGGKLIVFGDTEEEATEIRDKVLPDNSHIGFFSAIYPVQAVFPKSSFEDSGWGGIPFIHLPAPSPVFLLEEDPYSYSRASHGRSGNFDTDYHYLGFPLRDAFGQRDIPFGVICVLLFAFAIVVGPINLLLWAPAGKRHRLFFTTPLISLGASGALLIVMLLQDGMSIKGRSYTIIDLALPDAAQPTAIVYQEQFTRAGMVGSGGLTVEDGLLLKRADLFDTEKLSVIDNKGTGKWFSSRRDLSLSLTGAIPLRWHVSFVSKSDDAMQLRVECPVTEFDQAWFYDKNGKLWNWDENPSADGVMTLVPAGSAFRHFSEAISENGSGIAEMHIPSQVGNRNQRGRFYGITSEGEAGVRPTNPKIKWVESHLIITSKVVVPD